MHPRTAYLLYSTLFSFAFGVTVTNYVPLLFSIGLTLADVALLNAAFWGMIVLLEIPTGMFADGKSRRWSVRTGTGFALVGAMVYATVHNFSSALTGELLIGVGGAFISGAKEAWIVDALRHRNEAERIRHTFGTAALMRSLAMLVGGVVGALVGAVHLRLIWIVSACALGGAFWVCLRHMNDAGEPVRRVTAYSAFGECVRALRGRRSLRWAIGAAMVFGLVLPFNHYWSPFIRGRAGELMVGVVWVPMYLSLALAGWWVRRRKQRGGEGVGIISALLFAGGGLAGAGLCGGLVAPLMLIMMHEFGRGLYEPLLDTFTQHHIEEHYRATYGSFQSFLGKMAYASVLVVVWWGTRGKPTNDTTMSLVWVICGGLLIGAALILYLFHSRSSSEAK